MVVRSAYCSLLVFMGRHVCKWVKYLYTLTKKDNQYEHSLGKRWKLSVWSDC